MVVVGPCWMADLMDATQERTSISSFAMKRYSAPLRSLCVCVCVLTAQPRRPGVSAACSASWLGRGRTHLRLSATSH